VLPARIEARYDRRIVSREANEADLLAAAARGMVVAYWADLDPERPAVASALGRRTFAELDTRANQLARALRRRGLRPDDAAALLCSNRPEYAEVWAACQRAGIRLTPINWHLTAGEVGYIAGDCEAKVLIADVALAEVATAALADAPQVRVRLAVGGDIAGFESYEDVLRAEEPRTLEDPRLGTLMLYTSGTTGRPKGVHRAPVSDLQSGAYKAYRYEKGHVHLCTGPLYHAAPLNISMTMPLSCGVTVVIMERWDPEDTLRLIEAHRVSHTHLVPTMFHRLLALPDEVKRRYNLTSLLGVLHGAAPCPVHVKKAMIEWLGPVIYEYYAATEGPGTVVDSSTWLKKPGTVGKPAPAESVIVGDEDGNPLPAGEIGLVWLQALPTTRFQYFKDAGKTAKSYRGEYFTLGDIGYLDEDGFLFLTDRSANLIISGGVNIYPAEIDAVLLEHAAVADAAAIGVPNEEWGEEVKAVVQLKGGISASEELAAELLAHCRSRLAHYKSPRSVDFADSLPRLDNGKIYKHRLREMYRSKGGSR
jgi:long-chain acyl-CoA synthetase